MTETPAPYGSPRLCPWCASWEAIATSGEKGNVLDPANPSYERPVCGHPPDFWPEDRGTPPPGARAQPWPGFEPPKLDQPWKDSHANCWPDEVMPSICGRHSVLLSECEVKRLREELTVAKGEVELLHRELMAIAWQNQHCASCGSDLGVWQAAQVRERTLREALRATSWLPERLGGPCWCTGETLGGPHRTITGERYQRPHQPQCQRAKAALGVTPAETAPFGGQKSGEQEAS